MTNKEKYPNPRIMENPCAGSECGGTWYIRLVSEFGKKEQYLLKNQQVGPHDCDNPSNTYFSSEDVAQTALNNFMNETPEITLKEIKLRFEEAKKLIGSKVSLPMGSVFICGEVILDVSGVSSSYCCDEFFNKNGYVIKVCGSRNSMKIPYTPDLKPIKTVSVTAHDGQTYIAEDNGKTWKFGCAEISKELTKGLYKTIQLSPKNIGNRSVVKVTIGKCDFTLETLKALIELES